MAWSYEHVLYLIRGISPDVGWQASEISAGFACQGRRRQGPQHKLEGFDHIIGFPGEGHQGDFRNQFANVTSWSAKAVHYLLSHKDSAPSKAEVVCVVEHHLSFSVN
jgi:hypothetical protein